MTFSSASYGIPGQHLQPVSISGPDVRNPAAETDWLCKPCFITRDCISKQQQHQQIILGASFAAIHEAICQHAAKLKQHRGTYIAHKQSKAYLQVE